MGGNKITLNLTLEVFNSLIGTICVFIALIVTLRAIHRGMHYQYLIYTALVWVSFLGYNLFWTLAIIYESKTLGLIAFYLFIPDGFFNLMASDSLHRENIEPIKLALYSIMATCAVFTSFYPNAMVVYNLPNGDASINAAGMFGPVVIIAIYLPNLALFYQIYRMNKHAPKSLKLYSHLYLFGVFTLLFLANILVVTTLALYVPGIHMIAGGLGTLMMAITIAKDPKIMFILPFKAERLMVIDTRGGVPLFFHSWMKEAEVGDMVFYAGVLQGVTLILRESVKRGEVQEIHLADGIMLINRSVKYPIASVLVATKFSTSLRESLNVFAEKFYEKFEQYFETNMDLEKYASASELVGKIFPFLPDYD